MTIRPLDLVWNTTLAGSVIVSIQSRKHMQSSIPLVASEVRNLSSHQRFIHQDIRLCFAMLYYKPLKYQRLMCIGHRQVAVGVALGTFVVQALEHACT
jgi:hypothetical protein